MKSSNFGYIPALDHLRGFAALLVLFFHGCHLITHKLQSDVAYNLSFWPLAENPFTSLIIEGHTAVSLFFVLSAFVFTVGSSQRELNFVGFYRKRLLRTYPLFLFSSPWASSSTRKILAGLDWRAQSSSEQTVLRQLMGEPVPPEPQRSTN